MKPAANSKTSAHSRRALRSVFPFHSFEPLEGRRLLSTNVPTIAAGAALDLSQGAISGLNHYAESQMAIDPQHPALAVTAFTSRGDGYGGLLSYCTDNTAPNPTWITKSLDDLPGVHEAERAGELGFRSWINIQCAFDAKGTLFIAVENNGGLVILRNLNYDPTANSGDGTSFELLPLRNLVGLGMDKPVMAIGPDGRGGDGQAIYVTADEALDNARKVICAKDIDDPNVNFTELEPIGSTNGIAGTFCLAVEPNGDVVTLVDGGDSTLYSATYDGPQLQNYSTNGAQVAPILSSTIARPEGSFPLPLREKQDATGNFGTNESVGMINVVSMDVKTAALSLYGSCDAVTYSDRGAGIF